jgi:hypothetical protein
MPTAGRTPLTKQRGWIFGRPTVVTKGFCRGAGSFAPSEPIFQVGRCPVRASF